MFGVVSAKAGKTNIVNANAVRVFRVVLIFALHVTDIHQMTALSLLRVRPSLDFDKNKMSLRLGSGL